MLSGAVYIKLVMLWVVHRRRITTEEKTKTKTKVVAAVGGKNVFNSLPRKLFCLGRFWRIGWIHPFKSYWCNSFYNSNRPVQNSKRGKELDKLCPPNRNDDLYLFCLLYPSSMGLFIYSRSLSVMARVHVLKQFFIIWHSWASLLLKVTSVKR